MRLPGLSPAELELRVVELLPEGPGQGDLALALRVTGTNFHFREDHLWVGREAVAAFLAEFGALAHARSGRASLRFMSPHVLEFFAVGGTADLALHGRFTSSTRVGAVTLPTTVDFHISLGGEFVERAWAEFRRLLGST
ncbi:hypothetical protein [Deinococcus aetherius]|uniref:hypothetical protein n=1 Tax=Deinococcus aetherius TaxID=200252 RepID=UPI00222F219F|nr:hypothetical protein [Deinococcus aetherius]